MIAEQEKQAQSEYRRFGKMYRNGGVLVGLCLDEEGIPPTAEQRFEIAKKSVTERQNTA